MTQNTKCVFKADGQAWQVEIIFGWQGYSGFKKVYWFLGRKADNYVLGFLLSNLGGKNFLIWQYNYKQGQLKLGHFQGDYNAIGLKLDSTPVAGYVPLGNVPGYTGLDFSIASPHARITPQQGRIDYKDLNLAVYPVYNVPFGGEFHEFWAFGFDEKTQHPYHLIFYSNSDSAWVIDLQSGVVRSEPLGQARLGTQQVQITRTLSLK